MYNFWFMCDLWKDNVFLVNNLISISHKLKMAAISFSCKLKKCSPVHFLTFETGNFAIPFNLLGQAELKMVTGVKKKKIIYIGQAYHHYC